VFHRSACWAGHLQAFWFGKLKCLHKTHVTSLHVSSFSGCHAPHPSCLMLDRLPRHPNNKTMHDCSK
jgi:hypothetical protein